jgi:hypothetical protein
MQFEKLPLQQGSDVRTITREKMLNIAAPKIATKVTPNHNLTIIISFPLLQCLIIVKEDKWKNKFRITFLE